ncbi:MAG: hypothetical protein JXR10_14980 [Cyclobacteriaceae bacterium]
MKYFLTVCALLLMSSAFAQFSFSSKDYKNKDLEWMGMITFDEEMSDVQKLYIDDAGNTYVVLRFQWDMHLGVPAEKKKDPEPPKVSAGNSFGIMIQKIKPNQSIAYTKVIKLGDRDRADATSIMFNVFNDVTIAGDDLYMTGSFEFSADFGDGVTLTSDGRNDMFVVKLNGSGQAQWAIKGGGSGNVYAEMDPGGLAVTADASGENVYAIAKLNAYPKGGGTLDGQELNLSEHGATLVLMKISKEGKVLWFKKAPAGTGGSNADMSLDGAGNLYISGSTAFFLEWDGDKKNVNGLFDAFVMKLDPKGNFIWSKIFGSDGIDNFSSMSVDEEGNIALFGTFKAGTSIDGTMIIEPKSSVMSLANISMSMNSDGVVTSVNQFDGKSIIDIPQYGLSTSGGKVLFSLAGKTKLNGEKIKELGYYSQSSTGEVKFEYNPTYDSPAYTLIPAGIQKSDDSFYLLGKLMKTSELIASVAGAKAGALIEKQTNKNWVYKKDLDVGLLLLKINID